jgi:hypothetical protein
MPNTSQPAPHKQPKALQTCKTHDANQKVKQTHATTQEGDDSPCGDASTWPAASCSTVLADHAEHINPMNAAIIG